MKRLLAICAIVALAVVPLAASAQQTPITRFARFTGTMHVVANQLVEVDGDDARSETYGVSYHWGEPLDDPRRNFTTGFRYVDRFARRDGEWRIARRVAAREWTHVVPAEQHWVIPPERDGRRGRRDHSDALYEVFE